MIRVNVSIADPSVAVATGRRVVRIVGTDLAGTQGPIGPIGPPGAEGGTSALTANGNLLTRVAGVPGETTRTNLAADTAFTSRYVSQAMSTPSELAAVSFQIQPFTAGNEPFQFIARGFTNPGVGKGINNAMHIGYNAGRHSGNLGVVAGKPAIIMGFEDNYYDDGGDNRFGVEWYIEYWSPDGTSQQMFRPFYARIYSDSNDVQDAVVLSYIGPGTVGQFSVRGAADANLFTVKNASIVFSRPASFSNSSPVTINTTTGQAYLVINSAQFGAAITFQNSNVTSWLMNAVSTTQFSVYDKDNRQVVVLAYGATAATATILFDSQVHSNVSVTTPYVIGSDGANKNLCLKHNAAAGQIVFYNWNASAVNLSISEAGNLSLRDGAAINQFGATGSKIGGASTQKFGFWGATPIVRPTGTPAAAIDPATTMALVNDLRTKLIAIGLVS